MDNASDFNKYPLCLKSKTTEDDLKRKSIIIHNIRSRKKKYEPNKGASILTAQHENPIESYCIETAYYLIFIRRICSIPPSEVDNFISNQYSEVFYNNKEKYHGFLNILLYDYTNCISREIQCKIFQWLGNNQKLKLGDLQSSSNIIRKMVWDGHPQELFNGFSRLMRYECAKNKPYCQIDNVESFIYANFDFNEPERKPSEKFKYFFRWNADKHDLTTLCRELKKKKKICSTNLIICNFIHRTLLNTSIASIQSYLDGTRIKAKFSIDPNIFSI